MKSNPLQHPRSQPARIHWTVTSPFFVSTVWFLVPGFSFVCQGLVGAQAHQIRNCLSCTGLQTTVKHRNLSLLHRPPEPSGMTSPDSMSFLGCVDFTLSDPEFGSYQLWQHRYPSTPAGHHRPMENWMLYFSLTCDAHLSALNYIVRCRYRHGAHVKHFFTDV